MSWRAALVVLTSVMAAGAEAQEWRLQLDARAQAAAYRGVILDSIPAADVVVGSTGGPATPDGFFVRCPTSGTQCFFFRPGIYRQGGPLITTADFTAWGFGVQGLSVRVQGRYGFELGDADAWPGMEPKLQLIEGYADYTGRRFGARVGRQIVTTRLGFTGFDGGRLIGRADRLRLEGEIYLGFGLGRAVAIPVTSPALNPLDEFRPARRQLVAGAAVGWRGPRADARLDYQREVAPDTKKFVSERVALSGEARLHPRWMISAGTEYDLSNTWFGTSDLTVRYLSPKAGLSATIRQYRPHFDLWTIWGAFSPVPYHALQASGWVAPVERLQLRASAERFGYSSTETATPLVDVDNDGTRWGVGATFSASSRWTLDAGFRGEYGPGALADGFEGSTTFRPTPTLGLTAYASALERPLEFRFGETSVSAVGLEADWQAGRRLRVAAGAAHYAETRSRPDAASIDWTQTRLHARITLLLSDAADRTPLPPAIRRRPPAGGRR